MIIMAILSYLKPMEQSIPESARRCRCLSRPSSLSVDDYGNLFPFLDHAEFGAYLALDSLIRLQIIKGSCEILFAKREPLKLVPFLLKILHAQAVFLINTPNSSEQKYENDSEKKQNNWGIEDFP